MSTRKFSVCDCCGREDLEGTDDQRDYGIVKLDFKTCHRIQTDYTQELCGLCACRVKEVVVLKLQALKNTHINKKI